MRGRTRYRHRASNYHSMGFDMRGEKLWDVTDNDQSDLLTSSITDEQHGLRKQNPCYHSRFEYAPLPLSLPLTVSRDGTYKATVTCADVWAHDENNVPRAPFGSGSFSGLYEELLRDASGAMPLSANLVVNAIEFASVKTMIPQAVKSAREILRRKLGRLTLREMANEHLLYSFGVKPLITDIKGILNVRQKVKNRISELQRRSGRSVRISVRGPVVEDSIPASGSCYPDEANHKIYWSGTWLVTTQTALSADVTSFFVNDAASQVKLWSSALGLSSPLSSIWELIPFSFVADWLLPIGDTFSRLEDKLGLHETVRSHSLTNFVYSTRQTASLNASGHVASTNYPGWGGLEIRIPTLKESQYNRGLGIPAAEMIPPVGWSLNRTALSLSLIAQKVLR